MPGLNVTFSAEELELIREAAACEQVSLNRFAYDAVIGAASNRRIADVAAGIAAKSAELNERLAK